MNSTRAPAASSPDLERLGAEYFTEHQQTTGSIGATIAKCLGKIVKITSGDAAFLVVGCGPKPQTMCDLKRLGFSVYGVEPIQSYVNSANENLGEAVVRVGDAEHLPYDNESMHAVIVESVLEHVDSPIDSLRETYRVLKHGGVGYFYTTNRFHFSWSGYNGEFRVPFFNWFPKVVQESYVYRHLHVDPSLANFTPRPAVHWFCYSELCELGRTAGFFKFYSMLELADADDPMVARSLWRRLFVNKVRSNPWLRGLALLQYGSSIFMYKR
jgi:ubiquinone/menaquinone biosynthesis C-methylase UbiE